MTTLPMPVLDQPRLVIEFPHALSEQTAYHIARQLEDAQATGKPIVLQEGARIRHIDIEGRITPNDYAPPIVRLTGWALALGAAIGSAATLLLMAVLS